MRVNRLNIANIRNIREASLPALASVNLFYGANGSGKTSVLEALHLLSLARSFRSHKIRSVINKEAHSCVVFANLEGGSAQSGSHFTIGIERHVTQPGQIKLSGKPVQRISELAESLPLQLINAETFQLLAGSPSVRRQFLDWGVFHVEHRFHDAWKATQRCLKQRNTLLRHDRIDRQQLLVWDQELARSGEEVNRYREAYIEQFLPLFQSALKELVDLDDLSVHFHRGWDKELGLAEYLAQQLDRDADGGYTHGGPHRADLRFRYKREAAADVLSRGQQKLVVCAMRIAQAQLLYQVTGKQCLFLLDDLPAELDSQHRATLCRLLQGIGCQLFVTCVDPLDVQHCWAEDSDLAMFHVEHGQINSTAVVAGREMA